MSESISLPFRSNQQLSPHPLTARYSLRLFCIFLLTAIADFLFFRQPAGWTLGAFALLANSAILITHPALLKRRAAQIVLVANISVAAALVYSPSTLSVALAITGAFALASLIHMAAVPHALRWAGRLFFMSINTCIMPFVHLSRQNRVTRRLAISARAVPLLRLAFVPLLFGSIFIILFSIANPVIESWLSKLEWGSLFTLFDILRWLFWLAILFVLFTLIKPRLTRTQLVGTSALARTEVTSPFVSSLFTANSVILSLLMFNLLFGLQNFLDLKFLYAGGGFTNSAREAAYVNRGAWALIATALMAAVFVLIALRRGSPLAHHPIVRILLGLWIGQNVLLVGSSIQRTLNYVETYSLTYLRLCGLIWMGLVAVGLVLICWRVLTHRTNSWLVNMNAIATILVLVICCWMNFAGIIAQYNVRHAKEIDGSGAMLDVNYLEKIGVNSLPALDWYSRQLLQQSEAAGNAQNVRIHDVAMARIALQDILHNRQNNWRSWTAEGAWLKADRFAKEENADQLYEKASEGTIMQGMYDRLENEPAPEKAR
jgi:hypothetical protein